MNYTRYSKEENKPERFPENAPGDFYVQNEGCTVCGAPHEQAPDLIEHSEGGSGHCFFKKQPETPDELERAINAIWVSCMGSVRYGGKDEIILRKLYHLGLENYCDFIPVGISNSGIMNKAVFKCVGTIKDLYTYLIIEMSGGNGDKSIVDFATNNKDFFLFTYRFGKGLVGNQFVCNLTKYGNCTIEIKSERDCPIMATIINGSSLIKFLGADQKATDILYYNTNGDIYTEENERFAS